MSQANPTQAEIDKYAGHYVLYGDQSKAFRHAFPDSKAKAETIHTKASLLHDQEKVQQRIKELSIAAAEKADKEFKLDAEYVARRLKEIDELDVLDIMRDDMKSFKPLSEWPKVWRISISGLDLMTLSSRTDEEDIESIVKKIKWPDKTKNLELIGKLTDVAAFSDKLDLSNKDGSLSQVTVIGSDVNPQEAAKLYQEMMGKN
ncbi:terminase small subunit [Pseudoalteromonas sp.]|uniref:terminase small subunit n=1 Tax=Pseudoalteromonas sp. TaxID=53249 RepID=UPI003D13875D